MAVAIEPEKKGKLKKWRPKKWRAEYDRIVAYSAMGKSNVWIAQQMGFDKVHVSVILHLPQAIELADKLQARLRERIETNIPEVLGYVAQRTAERLKQVIDDDELFEKNPFAVIDRGMDVMKGLNHLRGGGNGSPQEGGVTNIGTVVISNGQKSDLMQGLEMIREVKRIHGTGTGDTGPQK